MFLLPDRLCDLELRSLGIESREIQNGMYDQMDRKGKAVFEFDSGLTACTGIIPDFLC